jgi:hypothetical protein
MISPRARVVCESACTFAAYVLFVLSVGRYLAFVCCHGLPSASAAIQSLSGEQLLNVTVPMRLLRRFPHMPLEVLLALAAQFEVAFVSLNIAVVALLVWLASKHTGKRKFLLLLGGGLAFLVAYEILLRKFGGSIIGVVKE